MEIQNRIAFVTGGASGNGWATVVALAGSAERGRSWRADHGGLRRPGNAEHMALRVSEVADHKVCSGILLVRTRRVPRGSRRSGAPPRRRERRRRTARGRRSRFLRRRRLGFRFRRWSCSARRSRSCPALRLPPRPGRSCRTPIRTGRRSSPGASTGSFPGDLEVHNRLSHDVVPSGRVASLAGLPIRSLPSGRPQVRAAEAPPAGSHRAGRISGRGADLPPVGDTVGVGVAAEQDGSTGWAQPPVRSSGGMQGGITFEQQSTPSALLGPEARRRAVPAGRRARCARGRRAQAASGWRARASSGGSSEEASRA